MSRAEESRPARLRRWWITAVGVALSFLGLAAVVKALASLDGRSLASWPGVALLAFGVVSALVGVDLVRGLDDAYMLRVMEHLPKVLNGWRKS